MIFKFHFGGLLSSLFFNCYKICIQATIDQLASEEALDLLLNYFASIDFCGGDESCPAILEWVLRSGAPFFAAAGPALGGQEDFTQVSKP